MSTTIGSLFVNLMANTSDFTRGMSGAEASLAGLNASVRTSTTSTTDFGNNLNNGLSGSALVAQQRLRELNRAAVSAGRGFGTNSQQAINARNAISEFALGLDDATFKQVYMKGQLGQTESAFNSQANAIKLNARMTRLMGDQTQILTQQMAGLQRHGIRPEMMLPPSTIGQFRLLNETMRAGNMPINMLSAGFRRFGNSMESTIKGWSAQKMAIRMANGDMVKYGVLLRGITAGQASLGMAFPLVGMASVLAYGLMFKGALNADKELKKLAETVGGKVSKAFEPLIKVAGQFLEVVLKMVGKLADLISRFNEAHPTIAKFASIILFLLPIMTLLLLPLNMGIGLFNGWKVAIAGLWAVIGPLVSTIGIASSTFLVFASVVAIVAGGLLYLWKTNDGFRNGCIKAWDSIKAKATDVFGTLVTFFSKTLPSAYKSGGMEGVLKEFGKVFKNVLTNINTLLPQFAKKGTEMLTNIANGITKNMPLIIQTVQTILQTYLQNIVNNLPIILNAGMQILMALIDGITQSLPFIITTVINIITTFMNFIVANLPTIINAGMTILMALINGILNNLPLIIDAAIRIINTIVDFIVVNLPMLIDAAVKIITALGNGLIANLPKLIDAALRIILAIVNGIAQNMPKIIQAAIKIVVALAKGLIQATPQIISAIGRLMVALGTGIIQGIPKAVKAMGKVASDMITALKNKIPSFSSIGSSIISGLASGITSSAGAVADAVKSAIGSAIEAGKKKLGINSPSKVFMAFGRGTGKGLAIGIDQEGKNVAKASTRLASSVVGGYSANLKGIKTNVGKSTSQASQSPLNGQIIVQSILDGKIIAETIAPFSDLVNGNRFNLAERGLAL